MDLEAGAGFVGSGNSPSLASAKRMSNFFFENACFDRIFGSERAMHGPPERFERELGVWSLKLGAWSLELGA